MGSKVLITPTKLYGLQRVGPSSFNDVENSGAEFSKELWLEFIGALINKDIPFDGDLYGISWPADTNTPPQEVFYFCGLESQTPIDGFDELELTGGNYLEVACDVPAESIDSAFHQAYMVDMPASGLQGRDGQHIEIYGDEYDPNSDRARFRILIPIK